MGFTTVVQGIQGYGIGWIIALIVLILCIGVWFLGVALTPLTLLGLIGALAVARLL